MKAKWLPLAAGVALAAGSVSASAVDFHGYARAGVAASMSGGEVYCSGNGLLGHRAGRLGDECDAYAELTLSQDLYNKNNTKFDIHTLVAYGTPEGTVDRQGNSWQGIGGNDPWGGQRMSIREIWSGYTPAEGYTIWAGNRYYQRKDIHIMDFYYLNNSGYGTGIENIDVGAGTASFAVIKTATSNGNWRNVYKLDARWNGIPVGFGTLDAAVIYGLPSVVYKQYGPDANAHHKDSGVLMSLDHASNVNGDAFSLMNHLIFQWGTNGFAHDVGTFGNHAGQNYNPNNDQQGVRLIDWGTLDMGNFGLGYSILWAHLSSGNKFNNAWYSKNDDDGDGRPDNRGSGWEYSIVLRPEYKWSEYTRTTLELGLSQQSGIIGSNDDPEVHKITLAQQFTPGKGFWTRPAIRFYASYQGGDQFEYKANNKKHHNFQYVLGSQVEAWW
ncbi:MAG: carbohydrate porin [Succinimonas sp.]|nr:carbohydrate porin [Succinimonas sp.]